MIPAESAPRMYSSKVQLSSFLDQRGSRATLGYDCSRKELDGTVFDGV